MRAKKRASAVAAALGLALVAFAAAGTARAEAPAADRAAAQMLFDEGMRLLEAKRYDAACPKLQESARLDPGIGARFNLADCYEHVGKIASAWTLFLDVAAATHEAGQLDREQVARARARALEPNLSKMRIVVTTPDVPGLVVERDGGPVGRALWGVAAPIDPGDHVVRAHAPGKKTWEAPVRFDGAGKLVQLTIPPLEDGVSDDPAAAAPSGAWSTRRWVGVVVGGAGLVGVGVGAALGLVAKSKNDEAHTPANCLDATHCYASGVALVSSAKGAATGSTIAFLAGGVALAGGVILFAISPTRATGANATSTARLRAWAGPGAAGATFGGAW